MSRNRSAVTAGPVPSNGLFHVIGRGLFALLFALAVLGARGGTLAHAQATPVASPVASPVSAATALDGAVAWLVSQQDPSGAFIGFSGTPDVGTTIDATLALASVPGIDAKVISSAAAYVDANAADYAQTGAGQAAKLVLFQVATGNDPAKVDGINPLDLVKNGTDPNTGYVGTGIYDESLAVLALAAADQTVPADWISTIRSKQISNGGWAYDGSADTAKADSNTTSIVIQALVAAKVKASDPAIKSALKFINSLAANDAGFAYGPADPLLGDANSTGIVIQALVAVSKDTTAATEGLLHFRNGSGAFRYMDSTPGDNLLATVQAVLSLTGTAFPVPPIQ